MMVWCAFLMGIGKERGDRMVGLVHTVLACIGSLSSPPIFPSWLCIVGYMNKGYVSSPRMFRMYIRAER